MKKLTYLLVALVFAFSLAGCGSGNSAQGSETDPPASTSAPEFDLEAFKESIRQCQADINDTSIYISNMGTYEYNFWEARGSLSDSMTERAYNWLAENSDATKESIEAAYESICQQYKEITLCDRNGTEAEKIYSEFDDLYHAFVGMYDLVTNPSGSISDFASDFNDYVEDIQESDRDLSLFLE